MEGLGRLCRGMGGKGKRCGGKLVLIFLSTN